jgi:flagellar biosynthesis anti-sigma factor FlgM
MKVENNPLNRLSSQKAEGSAATQKALQSDRTSTASALNGKDQAMLSDKAILLAKARAGLDEVPEVRSEKVEGLRKEIQTGNYQIPYNQIVNILLSQKDSEASQ